MERLTRELQDAKRKHYEHKRREQVRRRALVNYYGPAIQRHSTLGLSVCVYVVRLSPCAVPADSVVGAPECVRANIFAYKPVTAVLSGGTLGFGVTPPGSILSTVVRHWYC